MKIAVGVDGNTIAGHFGHSEDFQVFTVDDAKVVGAEFFSNPGHSEDMDYTDYVVKLGVDVAIGGSIGQQAYEALNKGNVEGIFGAAGEDARTAVEAYLAGELKHTEEMVVWAAGEPYCC